MLPVMELSSLNLLDSLIALCTVFHYYVVLKEIHTWHMGT